MSETWRIEGDALTITLDGPAAGTYSPTHISGESCVPTIQTVQGVEVILVGRKDGKPVYVKMATRPELAEAIRSYHAAQAVAYDAAHPVRCERCGQVVDTTTAYHQTERSPWGKVIAYYCDSCRSLLQTIGMGELSAMEERAIERPDLTPETKED